MAAGIALFDGSTEGTGADDGSLGGTLAARGEGTIDPARAEGGGGAMLRAFAWTDGAGAVVADGGDDGSFGGDEGA